MEFLLNIKKRSEVEIEQFEVSDLGEIYSVLEDFDSGWQTQYTTIFEEDMNEAISDKGFDIFEDDFSFSNFKIEDFEQEVNRSLRNIEEIRNYDDIIVYIEAV